MSAAQKKTLNQALGSHYLKAVHISAYGAFAQRNIGPFTPGLNVVFGANEAGKTTTSSFIGGVLFGWDDARGQKNVYKPSNAERSGTLTFAPYSSQPGAETITCTRVKNPEGIKPNPNPSVLDDIDKETYQTIFALDSDELLGLGNTSDITAHLLTAGAGTNISPAHALAEVETRLAACLSHAAAQEDSIPNLQAQLDQTKAKLDIAAEEAQRFKEEAREYTALQTRISQITEELATLNEEAEQLASLCGALERLQQEAEALDSEEAELSEREASFEFRVNQQETPSTPLASMDNARIRSLREELDEMHMRQSQLEHEFDQAQENYNRAKAQYASVAESSQYAHAQRQAQYRQKLLSALSFALPAIFAVASLLLFVLSRSSTGSIELVAAIVCLVAALVFGGLGPVFVAHFGQNTSAAEQDINQARNKLEETEQHLNAVAEQLDAFAVRVNETLQHAGLEQADGNVRYARALLDDVREFRTAQGVFEEQKANLNMARAALDANKKRNREETVAAFQALNADPETSLARLRNKLEQGNIQRSQLQQQVNEMNARYGQLEAELARAQHLASFDELKLEYTQLQTRMEESKHNYAQLLLVQRLLQQAIAAWETKSQPEVYRRAGQLLATMTENVWQQVRMDSAGELVVIDAFGNERPAILLSLGTCQQLYLALRISLLLTAENVGRCIPILADDILVNFDTQRRVGAIRALEALAKRRQVLLFTCHEEVVHLMQDSCAQLNLVEL